MSSRLYTGSPILQYQGPDKLVLDNLNIELFICLFAGKRKCIHNSAHVLKVLSDLLGHENQEVLRLEFTVSNDAQRTHFINYYLTLSLSKLLYIPIALYHYDVTAYL